MIRPSLTSRRVVVGAALAIALGAGVGLGSVTLWSAEGATIPQAYRVDTSELPANRSADGPARSSSAPSSADAPAGAPADAPAGAPADAPAPAPVDTSDGMTVDEAVAVAVQFAPGRVVEVDQDRDLLTGLRYDVTVLHDNGTSTEVEVDAESGQVVSTDFDNDWD
jgi:uncharacterized membrane protein YkoI